MEITTATPVAERDPLETMPSTILPTGNQQPPESRRKRQLQWLLFFRVVMLSILLGINLLLQSRVEQIITPPLQYLAYFIAGVYIFTISAALLLQRISKYTSFAYWQVLTDCVLVTVLVYFSGCSQSIFVTVYFFPIVTGSFILYRRGGLAVAAASTIGYGAMLLLEYIGYRPGYFYYYWYTPLENIFAATNYFAVHGITFFMVAWLSALLSERLRKTETALTKATLEFDRLALLYKQIFNDIDTGVITVDSHGRITSLNPASTAITGFTPREVLNRPLHMIFPELHRGNADVVRPMIPLTRKDGSTIPVGYSQANLHGPPGSEDCFVITLQNMEEITKMEYQVRQAEKMAAIGEMAAGIAHEFRNPLAAISGSAQMLVQQPAGQTSIKGLTNIIVRECGRLDATIADFLQFSKPAVLEKELLPLGKLLDEVAQLLEQIPEWHAGCRIVTDIPAAMDCWGDAPQLKRLLINLIHNSCAALAGSGGDIRISAVEETSLEQKESIVLTIADNGPGISLDNLEKIFEPFFTTRKNGTGLGLAIVGQIVESHAGEITVNSSPGEGTTFQIKLPLPGNVGRDADAQGELGSTNAVDG